MKRDLDQMLGALSQAPADHALDGLETQVFARIEKNRRETAGGGLTMQLAAAILALAIGVVVGEVHERQPARVATGPAATEMVVLSDGANLAPSVRLGGGA
jgi:ferric-dicitrate binding protein FerR (iron transport regulator)